MSASTRSLFLRLNPAFALILPLVVANALAVPMKVASNVQSDRPTQKEFRASPSFFAALNNEQRCNAIEVWVSSMRYEFEQPQYVGDRMHSGKVDLNQFNNRQLFALGTPAFGAVFGRRLPELTPDQLQTIGKSLSKCSEKHYVPSNLVMLFNSPQALEPWIANFESWERSLRDIRLAVLRAADLEQNMSRYQAELKRTGIPAAELIKDSSQYRLNGNLIQGGSDWCDFSNHQALVSLVFKADQNFQIDNSAAYWGIFESEMLPAIERQCPGADYIYIANYVEGSLLVYDKNLLAKPGDAAIGPEGSDPFSVAIYACHAEKGPRHRWFYGANSKAAVKSFFTNHWDKTREVSLSQNDDMLITIARMKERLKLRTEFVPIRTSTPLHNAGEKIFENQLYAVYKFVSLAYTPSGIEAQDGFCFRGNWYGSRMRIAMVFKVDADYLISLDAEYKRRVENEILPKTRSLCSPLGRVWIENYIYNRRLNRGKNSKLEEFGLQETFPNSAEDPLNRVEVIFNEGHIIYEQLHDWGVGIDARSLAKLRKSYEETKDLSLEARKRIEEQLRAEAEQAEAAEKEAAEKRIAEAKQQERIARDRPNHRQQAAAVLAYTKSGAPKTYDFSGYNWKEHLQNIYQGNFEAYMGGYESEAEYSSKMVGDTAGMIEGFVNGDWNKMIADSLREGATVYDVERRRAVIRMAFYGYHNAYRQQCSANHEMPWMMSNPYLFWNARERGGIEVSRSPQIKGISLPVREPFVDTYNRAYLTLADYHNTTPEIPQSFLDDFGKFLKAEGCASSSVRQFEINLYLATNWLLPLQVLREPEKTTTNLSAEQPKPKVTTKPKPSARNRKTGARP